MQRVVFSRRFSAIPDVIILMLVATVIYGVVLIGHQWRAEYQPTTRIDLSLSALPVYTLFSGMRGIAAYILSLGFTLVVGYAAAKSAKAERLIVPALDILQSIPVLGFLPGLVLGLVALFPKTNTGLELAAILMIFTGQVWNMTFSFYSSLKSIPHDFMEASTVIGLNWKERLRTLELPYSAVNLVWNSLLSMAGGWFFLSACEAFTLGDRDYRLPGVGAYMAVAVQDNNTHAMIMGILAMVLLIVAIDFFVWRPMLAWVQKFRLEDIPGAAPAEPLMGIVLRESRLLGWVKLQYLRWRFDPREREPEDRNPAPESDEDARSFEPLEPPKPAMAGRRGKLSPEALRWIERGVTVIVLVALAWSVWQLVRILLQVRFPTWVLLVRNTFWTLMRVIASLVLSTIWCVPFGIWVATSQRRIRIMQPVIQVFASFPAPMLYPIALALLFRFRVNFDWASMFLLMLGAQWYVLFNVVAGALRIPQQLGDALSLMDAGVWDRWRTLYIPSVFPALVTGWVTAAGGAWNASIVAEYLMYQGQRLDTAGLGATISVAAEKQDFPMLAASLSVMVVLVILLNRTVWSRLYELAQTRYRMDF